MRKFPLFAVAACWLFGISMPLPAQGATKRPMGRAIGDLRRGMSADVSQCIVRNHGEFVSSWLQTLPASTAEKALMKRSDGALTKCFSGGLAGMLGWEPVYDYVSIRAELIRFILSRGVPVLPLDPPVDPAGNWFAPSAILNKEAATSLLMNDLGFCIVRTDWVNSRRVAFASSGSREESLAIDKLVPLIGGCVPPAMKLRLDRKRLRSIVEEAMYHAVGGVTAETLRNVPPAQWSADHA